MQRPEPGLSVPVTLEKVSDADTLVVRFRTGETSRIRLIGCNAPEGNTIEGVRAKQYVECLLKNEDLWLHFPLAKDKNDDGHISLTEIFRQLFSFDRHMGRIWIESNLSNDLSELLIAAGHAEPMDSRGL